MLLPKGITGFMCADGKPIAVEEKLFKRVCYEFIKLNNGKILSIDISLTQKNFYVCEMILTDKCIYLLMNAYYPYFAFASSVNFGNIAFMDKPNDLITWSSENILLSQKELNESYDRSLGLLNHVELSQIKYWKPVNIGEIIYNFWD